MHQRALFILTAVFSVAQALDLPSNFLKCARSDPELNQCLKIAVQDALPKLEKGILLFNFPPIQPLKIPGVTVGEGKGTVHVVQKFYNVEIYNIIRSHVDRIDAKIGDTRVQLTINASLPEMIWNADYDFNGRILILPIVGKGKSSVIFKNLKADFYIVGEEFKKKGVGYAEIKELQVRLSPEKIIFRFDDLFNGDKRLGTEMNLVLNENWEAIWEDIRSGYEESIAIIFQNLGNLIFKTVPHQKLFPL